MPWGVVAGAAVGAIGSAISSGNQASAAQAAAADQQQAAEDQLSLSGNIFNAQSGLSLATREAGGLAQSREAYLLGLSPNLNINSDFSTPNITTNPGSGSSLSWNGPAGNDPSYSSSPVAFGGHYYGGVNGINGQNFRATSPTSFSSTIMNGSSAVPNPNASLPSSAYGSFSSPYNPSTFYQDPGYQFIQQQGNLSLNNNLAAKGMSLSGAGIQAALQYNTGLASQEFNNAYNRSINTQTTQFNELNALSSGGQIASSGLSTAASGLGAAGASALAGYGNAGAAGQIGAANAYSSGINGITNASLYGLNSGGIYGNSNALYTGVGGGMNGLNTGNYNTSLNSMGNTLTPTFTGD